MKTEEYGIQNDKIIVMLHGAHFVHTYGRQYPLAEKYHIIVPHIMGFGGISTPVIALAGEKEQNEVKESVKRMAELNPNCRYEIWDKAAHNIPPVFYKKFNKLICEMY